MKAICKLITKVEGNKVTITGEIIDVTFPDVVGQRKTILHPVATNPSHPRQFQLNSHGIIVTRAKADGVLLPKDELVSVMLEIDNKLTDAPVFVKHPTPENIVDAMAKSEIPMTGKCQHSDDGKNWSDIEIEKDFKPQQGKHYRMVAKNKVGETISNVASVPKSKETK